MSRQELERHYADLSTDELLRLHLQGTLTEIAYDALEAELESRSQVVPSRPPALQLSHPYSRLALEKRLRRTTNVFYVLAYLMAGGFFFNPSAWEELAIPIAIAAIAMISARTKNLVAASIFPLAIIFSFFFFFTFPGRRELSLLVLMVPSTFLVAIHFFTIVRLTANVERDSSWGRRIAISFLGGIVVFSVWLGAIIYAHLTDNFPRDDLYIPLVAGAVYFMAGAAFLFLASILRYFSHGIIESSPIAKTGGRPDGISQEPLSKRAILPTLIIIGIWVAIAIVMEVIGSTEASGFGSIFRNALRALYFVFALMVVVELMLQIIRADGRRRRHLLKSSSIGGLGVAGIWLVFAAGMEISLSSNAIDVEFLLVSPVFVFVVSAALIFSAKVLWQLIRSRRSPGIA